MSVLLSVCLSVRLSVRMSVRLSVHLSVHLSVCQSVGPPKITKKFTKLYKSVARRRMASYDVARLLLMAPIDPWRNFTPDFGAVVFCTTNIEDFRTPLTSTSSTISSTYSSQKRSLWWTSSKRKILEVIEEKHNWPQTGNPISCLNRKMNFTWWEKCARHHTFACVQKKLHF